MLHGGKTIPRIVWFVAMVGMQKGRWEGIVRRMRGARCGLGEFRSLLFPERSSLACQRLQLWLPCVIVADRCVCPLDVVQSQEPLCRSCSPFRNNEVPSAIYHAGMSVHGLHSSLCMSDTFWLACS
jgi:hypothetical protein